MKDVSARSDVIYSPNLFPSRRQISLPSLGLAVLTRTAAFDVTEDPYFQLKPSLFTTEKYLKRYSLACQARE